MTFSLFLFQFLLACPCLPCKTHKGISVTPSISCIVRFSHESNKGYCLYITFFFLWRRPYPPPCSALSVRGKLIKFIHNRSTVRLCLLAFLIALAFVFVVTSVALQIVLALTVLFRAGVTVHRAEIPVTFFWCVFP